MHFISRAAVLKSDATLDSCSALENVKAYDDILSHQDMDSSTTLLRCADVCPDKSGRDSSQCCGS